VQDIALFLSQPENRTRSGLTPQALDWLSWPRIAEEWMQLFRADRPRQTSKPPHDEET